MTDLITRHDASHAVSFTGEAHELRTAALDKALEVNSVTDEDTQAQAVDALRSIEECLKLIEDSRQLVAMPVYHFWCRINTTAKDFVKCLVAQKTRIARDVGNYQALELAKQRSAEFARNENLSAMEREREAKLAEAKTFEERDAVHEEFNQAVAMVPAVPVAPKVKGQIVKEEWEFEVTDKRLLAQMHPHLVNIEPRRAEIKDELRLGHKIHGIEARKVVNASVRVGKVKEIAVSVV